MLGKIKFSLNYLCPHWVNFLHQGTSKWRTMHRSLCWGKLNSHWIVFVNVRWIFYVRGPQNKEECTDYHVRGNWIPIKFFVSMSWDFASCHMSLEEQKSNAPNDTHREILPSSTSRMLLFLPNNKQFTQTIPTQCLSHSWPQTTINPNQCCEN